jgi:cell division transport system permease protein
MLKKAGYKSRVNYLSVVFSMALVLFMLGLFGYALLFGTRMAVALRESIQLVAELREDSDKADASSLMAALRESRFVKPESVKLITKEEAARTMKAEFGEDFSRLGMPNPFFDIITFNVPATFMHPDSLEWIREALVQEPIVSEVFYQENVAELIAANIKKVAWGALLIAIFFIFAAATLIHNTVRLSLFANRFLIKNMELVGATWGFISRPYLKRAIWHGLMSGLVAAGALWGLHSALENYIPQWREMGQPEALIVLSAILVLLGMVVNAASTFFVVRKYLRLRVDDLF